MQYTVKGSEGQWARALDRKNLDGPSTVQIRSVREKRKIEEEEVAKEASQEESLYKRNKKSPKKASKKSCK